MAKYPAGSVSRETIDDESINSVGESVRQMPERSFFDDLCGALECAPEKASIRIHRQLGTARDEQPLLDIISASEYEADDLLKMIKRRWGGGKFRLYLRDPNSSGNVRNILVVLAGAPKDDAESEKEEKQVAPQQNLEQTIALAMSAAMAPLVERLNVSRETDDERETRMLDKMAKYKTLFGGGERKAGGLSEVTSAIEFLKTIGMDVVPRDGATGAESDLERMIGKVSPLIQTVLDRNQRPQAAQGQEMTKGPMELAIELMIHAAQANESVEPYVNLILPRINEGELRGILELGRDAVLSMFEQTDPRISAHKGWFGGLVDALAGALGVSVNSSGAMASGAV
jgi:hypothetical protein